MASAGYLTGGVLAALVLASGVDLPEALAISVYCALAAPSFEDAIVRAVNRDGDSDSTGSITGNLLGARLGVEAIPPRWLASLELREIIEQLADDLASYRDWPLRN